MLVQKIHWDDVPTEQVAPKMQRKLVYGEKVMVARMKFKDGFVSRPTLIRLKNIR